MALCGGCLEGIRSLFTPPENHSSEEDDFCELLGFLGEVPLFKKQLSRGDLPAIAEALQVQEWAPGEPVVKQGQASECFYLVKSGKALVVLQETANQLSTELLRGDFFGARSLVEHIPMVATVCAAGPDPLVTLVLTRQDFEALGMNRKMIFPPRPAIEGAAEACNGLPHGNSASTITLGPELDAEETEFLERAIHANANLKVLVSEVAQAIPEVAKFARRTDVVKGQEVVKAGQLATDFIIVSEGSLDIIPQEETSRKATSAEGAVYTKAKVARKLEMKAQILKALGSTPTMVKHASVFSVGQALRKREQRRNSIGTPAEEAAKFKVGDCVSFSSGHHVFATTNNAEGSCSKSLSEGQPIPLRHISNDSFASTVASPTKSPVPQEMEGVVADVGLEMLLVCAAGQLWRIPPTDCRRQETKMANKMDNHHKVWPGESFGELSLLYNTHMMETYVATEDSVLYAIPRKYFKAKLTAASNVNKAQEIKEFAELLDEVYMLSPLLVGERQELARNATGRMQFQPGEQILRQGVEREYPQWFVVEKGEAVVSQFVDKTAGGGQLEELGRLMRGSHFGERSLLKDMKISDISVHAGQCGLTCLAIDGDILKSLDLGQSGDSGMFGAQNLGATASEYFRKKAKHGGGGSSHHELRGQEVEMADLSVLQVLGRGGFGLVSLVSDKRRNVRYALKQMSKGKIAGEQMERRIIAERDIMSLVRSPFLLRLYRTLQDGQFIYFLTEVAMGGDLLQVRHNHPELFRKGSTVGFYTCCMALALEHLHGHRIIFRDLKPENVLLNEHGYAKLCDFGFARFCFRKTHTFLGTPGYMAPEMIDVPHRHDHMVDWWALGIMAFELFAGRMPFGDYGEDGEEDPHEQLLISRRAFNSGMPERLLPGTCTAHARDMMRKLLRIQPTSRLCARYGAKELYEHKWIESEGQEIEAIQAQLADAPFTPEVKEASESLDRRPDAVPTESDLFVPFKDDGSGWHSSF